MSDKPPPFAGYTPVSGDELWAKILSDDIEAHIYSSEARGDFEPVPISAAEFVLADQAGCDQEYGFSTRLKPFQILWRDADRRRSDRTRRRVRVPHWVYVRRADLAPKGKGGRKGVLDKLAVSREVERLMDWHGDFRADDPQWNAQARLINAIREKFQTDAADSTIEGYVKKPLAEWRERHPVT
jgi:hypothetical protein